MDDKQYKCVRVIKAIEENPEHKTLVLDVSGSELGGSPGQFFMVWLPGVDEKPFTLSSHGTHAELTFKLCGRFTHALWRLRKGDRLWLRGPFGNGYVLRDVKHAVLVAAGVGAAPIKVALEHLVACNGSATTLLFARNSSLALFRDFFAKHSKLVELYDDKMSRKQQMLCVEEVLSEEKAEVLICGPEPLMKSVFDICEQAGVHAQLSFERYMKCGIGVCGQCSIDSLLVCKDGPVFSSEQVRAFKEFGCCWYDAAGSVHHFSQDG
jgi:dihydroorotate dehydrogenase electron transfer subunit